MDRLETLMSKYPNIDFKFDKKMPLELGGYTIGNRIIINANISKTEQYQWLLEEIGHVKTSIGDISNYHSHRNMQQENEARKWGYRNSISESKIKLLKKKHLETDYEIADELGLQVPYLHEIGFNYGLHFKHVID
ncbi:ImmA/IrrE family metallo-endopeptidase [Lactiplantibacillus mudanjiangensis]|uniref:IrrE N-terminal-like domain-containing protein n=1 Tax=Lactiplantibacillus mudanjiangensis TaxID=1296538 RepID=A0A660E4P0_9LACO|nr:ImmA/IrrE family metallo-endopeptidase [Lactiplantibacillus mudanjiangensis]VDG25735.1 hypothetical protein [Lactobacillus brevis] [Lactiplantibacillus mudanjiangensis]VDG27910.1 hypothetical protein [Lactobacillus brevis] [Lactiplantibacillus mudanjiangensis]